VGEHAPTGKTSVPLLGVDCPDGLARCTDGVVQVSRGYSYPTPCKGLPPDRCTCPWIDVGSCERGCVLDSLEIAIPAVRAVEQLCAPPGWDGGLPAFADEPPPQAEVSGGACEGELYRCAGGAVIRCGDPPTPVATCRHGCTDDGASLDDEDVGNDGAVVLLCAH
jgi:hypothetical protein